MMRRMRAAGMMMVGPAFDLRDGAVPLVEPVAMLGFLAPTGCIVARWSATTSLGTLPAGGCMAPEAPHPIASHEDVSVRRWPVIPARSLPPVLNAALFVAPVSGALPALWRVVSECAPKVHPHPLADALE